MIYDIPRGIGEPGTPSFRAFDDRYGRDTTSYHSVADADKALDLLRQTRREWDNHLSKMDSSSERLLACLEVLCTEDTDRECSLLFDGMGRIYDVIHYHASMDMRSINGPVNGDHFPNTQLGYWVNQYLHWAHHDIGMCIASTITATMGEVILELLAARADITPFFKPMDSCPSSAFYLEYHQPGMNALQCMMNFSDQLQQLIDYYYNVHIEHENDPIHEFDWITKQLQKYLLRNRPTLRFDGGDKVKLGYRHRNRSMAPNA